MVMKWFRDTHTSSGNTERRHFQKQDFFSRKFFWAGTLHSISRLDTDKEGEEVCSNKQDEELRSFGTDLMRQMSTAAACPGADFYAGATTGDT